MKDKILDGLNSSQSKVVTYGEGPLLVLAGAGSGKTRVLTHRIAYLIAQGIPSFNFLAVTFTNKAAQEMKDRIKRLVRSDVWVSTFHASCLRILRSECEKAGLQKYFSVYDENDQLALIRECLNELKLDHKQFVPKMIRERINRAKDELITAESYQQETRSYQDEVVARVYDVYEKKLKQYNGIDFGGLISTCIELFEKNPSVLSDYQRRFHYILIDEYQDTNHAQYRWIKLLAAHHKNLMVVGDPDQAIYGWRGADVSNILSFEKDYSNVAVIKLDKNYRSTENILNASNALILHNLSRKEKALWTDKAEGEPLLLCETRDEREEARALAENIVHYRQEGTRLDAMVVFYRIHAQSRVLEEYLRRYNIPYRIIGGVRFYDRKEIKDIMAFLKVIACPEDEVSLKRIINVPVRGIGIKALHILGTYQKTHTLSLYATLAHAESIQGLSNRARTSIQKLYTWLEELRAKKDSCLPSKVVQTILHETGYAHIIEREQTIEARARVENIKEFIGAMTEFEDHARQQGERALLGDFLDMISLETSVDQLEQGTDILNLMTIHCAKGLEFDVVFMVGMEEDIFPHSNVLNSHDRDLEEERRLCYVGLTRAREQIILSYARSRRLYGMRMYNMPSRFLSEIPREYISYVSDEWDYDGEEVDKKEELEYDYRW
ncbi:MAG: UvrD-helicase domain-containing protein [Candidatus Omnitrophica bacterium]|nr:UvrD-helicase domain-containing protein [Candidatus Omnitrophota bacterium]